MPGLFLVLAIALLVRAAGLLAGWPYLRYVDEGHVLHPVIYLLASGDWDPHWYSYPSFPMYCIVALTRLYAPIYEHGGQLLSASLSPFPPIYYDIVQPQFITLVGRLLTLAASMGIVALCGLLARRLAGDIAGLAAALLAALVPALVIRSAVVMVDPWMVFFVLCALFVSEGIRSGRRLMLNSALAGAFGGLALVSKYPGALVMLAVGWCIFSNAMYPLRDKLKAACITGVAFVSVSVLSMPALAIRTETILNHLGSLSARFGDKVEGVFWEQAILRAEWDLPLDHPELGILFVCLAIAALVIVMADRRLRWATLGWLLFGGSLVWLHSQHTFRPFRYLLPLVPLACLFVALAYARLRTRVRRPSLLDIAGVALVTIMFGGSLWDYGSSQLALQDPRTQTIAWLNDHADSEDSILFQEELAFLPVELKKLNAEVRLVKWPELQALTQAQDFDFLVLGDVLRSPGVLALDTEDRKRITQSYILGERFGSERTPHVPQYYRGNDQSIYIFTRGSGGATLPFQ